MRNVRVYATADTLSFGAQTSKTFFATATIAAYVKTILHFQKRQVGQREYLYLDLHGKTAFPNPTGRMVVYGVNGTVSKVPSTVFDQIFFVKDGKMHMQVDLDMNGKNLSGLANAIVDSQAVSFGFLKKYSLNELAETILREKMTRQGTDCLYQLDHAFPSVATFDS